VDILICSDFYAIDSLFAYYSRIPICMEYSRMQTNEPPKVGQRGNLSDYLAAERTHLAWIRTGLALMGFGFVVARF
jgi:hypothetical protein